MLGGPIVCQLLVLSVPRYADSPKEDRELHGCEVVAKLLIIMCIFWCSEGKRVRLGLASLDEVAGYRFLRV